MPEFSLWALAPLISGVGGIFYWRMFRRYRIHAQESPLPEAELEALRLRASVLPMSPVKKRLLERVRSEEDWRWAARQERSILIMTLAFFGCSVLLFLVAILSARQG